MGLKKGRKPGFTTRLMQWHRTANRRKMPWKGVRDPYKVWLSEVILQQTRVEQGWAYYERFIEKYPTVGQLALAPDDEVFKLWEGLGYYSRCRNLLRTARYIALELNGAFPSTHPSILALSGIGPYTAAAIASFAFGLPHAVVDGNVIRVISRYHGITDPVEGSATRRRITALAEELLDPADPAGFNQAMMDLGATICKPRQPLCASCPLRDTCVALAKDLIATIPVKARKPQKTRRFFHYIIFEHQGQCYVRKRSEKDIWHGLYEFFLVPADSLLTTSQLTGSDMVRKIAGKKFELAGESDILRQQLTHQEITGRIIHLRLHQPPRALEAMTAVDLRNLHQLAFPKFIVSYMHGKFRNLG